MRCAAKPQILVYLTIYGEVNRYVDLKPTYARSLQQEPAHISSKKVLRHFPHNVTHKTLKSVLPATMIVGDESFNWLLPIYNLRKEELFHGTEKQGF